MDNQNYIKDNNQMNSRLTLNKAQQQEDILQQQQSISEDKLLFRSPQFTRISYEQESQQNDKNASLLQQEFQCDQSYISCAQSQNNQLAQQISDKKSFFITNLPSKSLEYSSSIIQVRKGRKTIDRQKRDDTMSEYQNKSKKQKRKDFSKNSQIEENELIYQQDEIITNQVSNKNEKIWVQKFYKILTFINRFVVRNKQRLIYFHPNQLQSHQAQAINDLDPIPVILPYNNFSLGWDLIILILILINVIKIPYELAFNNGDFSVGIVSYVSRAIFFLDFFMMFNTAFYENGVLEKQRSKIFIHFLKRRLVVEGCTYVCLWFNPFGIKLFRIFFLIKFLQFYDTIEKLAEAFQLSYKYNFIVKLIVLLIEVVLLCHLFACIWYSIGNYEVQNSTGLNWIQKFSTDNNNQYQQYIDSIYFSVVTIGTIGYGDIVPVSTLEKACLTAMAIFSCGIFAYILSNIQNVYREYQMKQEVYLNKLVKLNNYMFNREVNPNLQQMARKYLEYVHKQGYQQGVMPCETLNSLSISLRQEIKEDIFKKSINNIKYLQNFSNQFKIQLSRKMTEINYGPDEFIMKKGQQQQPRMYFILKGQVEVCLDKGLKNGSSENNGSIMSQPFSLQKQNDVLGLFEFTSQSQTCVTNARSIGVTTVHVLALDDFLEIINQNTNDKEIYYQLKDKINLYHNYEHVKLFCYSCKSSQHLINDCPLFFYKPNEERVVNKYIKEQNYLKKNIRKKTNQRFNSLAILNSLKQDIQDFCDQNESEINSMYQSQSTINECSLHNFDANEGLLHQQSNLSPLKPKSEVNLRLIKYRKSKEEDQINEQNDLQTIQVEFKDKMKKIDLIQQEIKQYQNLKTPEDFNMSSSDNQNQLNNLKTMPEKNVQEIQLLNNFEGKQRKSFNISVVVPKRNSILADNKLLSNILHESFQTQPLENMLNQINQKQFNENQKHNKDFLHENNKVQKSQTSFQHKRVKNENNISFTEIQKALNLLATTIVKKDNKNIQDDIQDELITDTIRSYQYYMIHNNAATVIKKLNLLMDQKREIQRQKILDVFSTSVQYRSICQKV